ncbi:MAG TPA: hypothetical protein GX513_07545 [Firmicutes bacterium]|nr:hypothetical protein [Bacillota bacterium]
MEVNVRREPAQIISRGRRRAVVQVQNRWRIDDEWWRGEISRMYYQVVLADNSFRTIFQDLHTGRWYEQPYPPGRW